MMRLIAVSGALGALIAAGIAYAIITPARVNAPPRTADAKAVAVEEWPMCTTTGSLANASVNDLDPDFAAGITAMSKGQWASAIEDLKLASMRDPPNPDIQNYIGYSYRRIGIPKLALEHFQRAIEFNPRHRGAHQHLGETYLSLGELAKAKDQLVMLERICLIPCEEYGDLARAIALGAGSGKANAKQAIAGKK